MSKVIKLSDDQYRTIERAAVTRGQSPDALLMRVVDQAIEELRDPRTDPRYYETDDWLRHLGVSEDMIAEVNREMAEEEDVTAGQMAVRRLSMAHKYMPASHIAPGVASAGTTSSRIRRGGTYGL